MLGKRTNVLILKDDVGRAKPTTKKLPGKEFAFGNPNKPELGAATCISSWAARDTILPAMRHSSQPKDFKTINKKAAQQGMVTAK